MKRNLYPLFLLACWLMSAAGLNAQTPVANYTFSGHAKDQSSFANHASVNGATLTQDRFGWSNSAFDFDGAQSGVRANNAAQLNSANVTISFWVKPRSFPAQGEVYLLSHGGYQERWKISVPDHGKPVFTTHNNGACCSDLDSGTPLTLDVWTHVAMVHDGAKDIIYFNGVKVNEKNTVGALDVTSFPLGIGFDPINNDYSFDGAIDDVELFDIALSDAEIAALYAGQSIAPAITPGKVASYSFSGNGFDDSDFGNHADILSAKTTTDRFGFGNSALLIDGANGGVTASSGTQLNSGLTTISFWVKPNAFAPPGSEVYLLSNGGYQERWKISMPDHGKPVFTTHSNGACCSDLDSGTPLTVGTWTHVVMVHDGAKDIIYFNGVKVNEKNTAGMLDATTFPLGIGFDPINNSNVFDGALDELEIYNVALSDTEIADLYAAESAFPGTPSDLVASYSLNGNGIDASQFGNDAKTYGEGVANRHDWGANAFTGYATADNSAALQSDYTTISFWVKPNAFAPPGSEVYLLSSGGYQERFKISMPDHGKPVFTTHAGGACCSDMDSGTPLTIGTWTHVAMVHDGAKDIIYFNGAQVNEKNVAGALDKTKYPLGIGYDPLNDNGFFDGSLDDIQIYSRALTAGEIAALYTAQNATPVIGGNLVADYRSNGNANDATAYQNNAAVQGAQLATDRFGKANMAYSFNGVDQSLLAANSPQQNSALATISFWVKPNAYAPPGSEVYLLSSGGYQERFKISMPDHGKPVFTTHAGGACCSDMDSGTPLTIGTWTHVAMVHDGAKDIIYFNGSQVNEKNVTGNLDATSYPLGIGFDPINNSNYFDGSLDEIQLYNVALSATEIADLYASQIQPPVNADLEAPCAPLNLMADVSFTNVQLSWLPATDNVGVVAYNVYQDGATIATVPGNANYVSGLTPLTDYVFGVSAIDVAGNESLITTLKVTSGVDETPDTTPPTAPGNVGGTAASNSVLVTWDASIDDTQVAGYVIIVDGVVFDTVSGTTLSIFIDGLDPLTLYTFEVYAFDLAGNNSPLSEVTLSTTAPIDTGEPGMVAHYPFDGNANDATPYHNDGVIGGNPVFITADHQNGGGQAIRFDGDQDSVLVPNAVQLISDYATVSFWIRVDSTNIQNAEAYIMDFGHYDQRWKISLPQHLKIVWTTNGNNVQFPVFISDMDSGDGNELVKSFWWYVTMVHDGTNDIIYVNGVQVNIKPVPTKLNSTARPLAFGNNPIEGGQYFIGALDNVKIYNKALTAGEIDNLYLTGTTATKDQFGDLRGMVLSVSPNPTTDVLTVQHAFSGKDALLVRVFDLAGRQVDDLRFAKNEVPTGQFSLNVHNYPVGNYTLNFVLGGKNIGSVQFSKQ